VVVCDIYKSEGPRETELGRGIRGIGGGEGPVHEIGLEGALEAADRVVMFVIYEEDGQIRTDCEAKTLCGGRDVTQWHTTGLDGAYQEEAVDDGVYQSHRTTQDVSRSQLKSAYNCQKCESREGGMSV